MQTLFIIFFTIIQIISYSIMYYLWKQNNIKGLFLSYLLICLLYIFFIKIIKKIKSKDTETLGDFFGTFGIISLLTIVLYLFFTIFGMFFAKKHGLNIMVSLTIPITHLFIILLIISLLN